jgi:hypothetical protein
VGQRDPLSLRPLSTEGKSLLTVGWTGSHKKKIHHCLVDDIGWLSSRPLSKESKQSLTDRTTEKVEKKIAKVLVV